MIAEGVSTQLNTALIVMIGRSGGAEAVKEGLTGCMRHHKERMRLESGVVTIGVEGPRERVVSRANHSGGVQQRIQPGGPH